MQQNKVLFIINSLGYGGAETYLLKLSKALLSKDWNVSLVTLTDDLVLADKLDKRIKHYKLKFSTALIPLNIFKLFRIINIEQPKVIHSHLFQSNILGRFIKFFNSKIRLINTTHCVYDKERIAGLSPFSIYKFTKKWVDIHTAVSEESLETLLRNNSINLSKGIYIPNGIFVEPYDSKKVNEHKSFMWLAVGRLIPVKNYNLLLLACEKILKTDQNFKLHIAGDGFQRRELEALIISKNLSKTVYLLGNIPDIPALMENYDAFVFSSDSEGLPMTLLEAMSKKLPIVSTSVGAITEIIQNSDGGFLVKPKSIEGLSIKMLKLMSLNKGELQRLGRNNFNFLKNNFTIELVAEKLLKVYNQ